MLGVEILQPQFTIQNQNLAKGCQTTLLLESVAGNPVVYQTRDTSIVSIVSYNQAGVVVKAKKVGSTTVVAQVDGVQTECVITVTNPKIKKAYGFYQKEKTGGQGDWVKCRKPSGLSFVRCKGCCCDSFRKGDNEKVWKCCDFLRGRWKDSKVLSGSKYENGCPGDAVWL